MTHAELEAIRSRIDAKARELGFEATVADTTRRDYFYWVWRAQISGTFQSIEVSVSIDGVRMWFNVGTGTRSVAQAERLHAFYGQALELARYAEALLKESA